MLSRVPIVIAVFLVSISCGECDRVISINTNKTNSHLVVNKISGDVYVGATNRVFQFNEKLELVGVQKVGPLLDSPACFGYRDRICPSDRNVTLSRTENYNKVLVIDYERDQLIHCGSVYQGICWIVGLRNVSDSKTDIIDRPVVANDQNSSSVAFIAPGPPDARSTKVLYVAASFTGNSGYRHNVPSVSSRRLDHENILDYVSGSASDSSTKTRIFIANRVGFPVRYIYGFSSNGFSYFLSVQKKSALRNSPFGSKLIRVCHNDANFVSYTEIPIECRVTGSSGRRFPLVQAAFLGNAGRELAKELDVENYDEVLYATFSTATSYGSDLEGGDSALCAFPMGEIRRKFQENIQNCFNGEGRRGLDYIQRNAPCVQDSEKITEDFCGGAVNSPFGGESPVVSHPTAKFSGEIATAVAVSIVGETTVAFVGTNQGEIKKLILSARNKSIEYDSIMVERGEPILPDLEFDPKETHLYALTKNKVTKAPVHEKCSRHLTCEDCSENGDPYCGWCSSKSKCTTMSSCGVMPFDSYEDSQDWLSYKNADKCGLTPVVCNELASDCATCTSLDPSMECGWCSDTSMCQRRAECASDWLPPGDNCTNPKITSFSPLTGPLEGGTEMTIRLSNMPSNINTAYVAVTVAGVRCMTNAPGLQPFNIFDAEDGNLKCRIIKRPSLFADEKSGPVVLHSHFRIESRENFSFVDWAVDQIDPTVGPLRGGTRLSVFGQNLDAGTTATVMVGAVPCAVMNRAKNQIECITGSFYERGTFGVKVTIDGSHRELPPVFSYVDNPIILRTKNPVIHGTLRGGGHVSIEGRHLDAVQKAFLVVVVNNTDYRGACNITTEDFLYCATPKIEEDPELLRTSSESEINSEDDDDTTDVLVLPYKFELDTVDTYITNVSVEKHQYFLQLSGVSTHHEHGHENEGSNAFGIAVTVILVLLIIAIIGFFMWRRYGRDNRGGSHQYMLTATEMDEFQKGKPKATDGEVLSNENPYVVPYNNRFEIPEKRFILDLDTILGQGNFGVVTKGAVDGSPVAVKTVKPDAEKMHLTSLMSELKILVFLGNTGKHPNIVNLIGAHTKNMQKGTLYVFVEYCPLGSLDKYLKSHRTCFCNQLEGDSIDLTVTADRYENLDPTKILCTLDLINFAHQIAKGMEYLAEKKVIHADLATRNLLLYDKTTVKITDFGLARKLYDYTNYVKKHQEPLPWRWMAIESLRDLSFSQQSDVWAYGITLWEIFTLGDMPYPGLSWAIDFTARLQQGLQNVKPKFATNDIYNTMRECWRLEPNDRPNFSEIRKFFNSMLSDLSSQANEHFSRNGVDLDAEGYLQPLIPQNHA